VINRDIMPIAAHHTPERTLTLATWLDIYQPEIAF
jgi:hypothetical protein